MPCSRLPDTRTPCLLCWRMDLHPTGKFDNHAEDYQHIRVVPLASAMGAEVQGVHLADLGDAQFAEIADALYHHKMLFLRDQQIDLRDQENLTLRFGPFGTDAYTTGTEGHPNVQRVVKEADVRVPLIFGSGWHTDSPFLERPPAISIVFGADIPPFGGDTIWANGALAYAFLSDTMKEVLRPLKVHMSARDVMSVVAEMNKSGDGKPGAPSKMGSIDLDVKQESMIAGSYHPIVRTHPVTGEKALYVDETYSQRIDGMTEAEGTALLQFLQRHVTQPAFTCRLRWAPKTLAIWDNRLCIHQAFNDHDGYRRELHRTIVQGEVPA